MREQLNFRKKEEHFEAFGKCWESFRNYLKSHFNITDFNTFQITGLKERCDAGIANIDEIIIVETMDAFSTVENPSRFSGKLITKADYGHNKVCYPMTYDEALKLLQRRFPKCF